MPKSKPVTMMCRYQPVRGKEKQLFALVKKHWPALHKAGLTTNDPAIVYKAVDKHTGKTEFVEIFSWKNDKASALAHASPEVMAIWEPMGPILVDGPSPKLAVIERVGG